MTYNEKRQNNSLERFIWNNYILSQNCSISKTLMSKLWDVVNRDTHKEIIAKLDYEAPSCPDCGCQMKKYDFQKSSKIPYLETTGMPTRILLKKRRFKCYHCSKVMVAETSLVKKNHQIPRIINQKITQKLIEKTSMTDIAISFPFQLQLSFVSSMISTLSMIFLVFLRLCPGMSMLSLRER